ncbi:probable G-protein coupled receptor 34 [Thunnus albacares]|uniref:probable G-protein coupled receptor 34 n=1 Tax=Thunnus albacares TaxID=8236 RepID=UPI001CF6C8C0|nr:probable G-protein coupled receptor 34 [Thunnus albacares]
MTTFPSSSSFPSTSSAPTLSNSSPSLPVSMSMSFITATSPPSSSSPLSFSNNSFNNSSPTETPCSFDDPALRMPLVVVYSLFFLFGLVGNIFALWVFLCLHKSRNSVRVFLINCAVADLVLLACLPFRVFYHLNGNQWVLGYAACKLVGNLFYMNMYISITLLGLISLDRYLRLKGKGRARRGMRIRLWGCNRPWSSVACAALWGMSLLAVVPMIATAEDKEDGNKCFQYKTRQYAKGKAYFNGALVLLFWLVFLMLVVSYAKIASQLLRVSRDKPDLPNAQRYQRTAKKSFFVLFLFTICFAPYHAFRPIYILSQLSGNLTCDYMQMVDRTNEVMLLFSAFNSCLDPVMYFLLSGSVRKTAFSALGHRLGNRLLFLNDATSNSSTTEFRRPSVPAALHNPELNTPASTPRSSICVINSNLRRTCVTTFATTGRQ